MRLTKDITSALNEAVKQVVDNREDSKEAKVDEDVEDIEEKIEDQLDLSSLPDSEIANMVIRYNQVVNRALRARFMSKTTRKAV